jgi:hypothetical protein
MYDERMEWIQKEMFDRATRDIKDPINIEDYYKKDIKPEEVPDDGGKGKGKDKKGDKGKDKKEKGKDKKEKGKKGKKEKEEKPPEVPPHIYGPTDFTRTALGVIDIYNKDWRDKDESKNHQQVLVLLSCILLIYHPNNELYFIN